MDKLRHILTIIIVSLLTVVVSGVVCGHSASYRQVAGDVSHTLPADSRQHIDNYIPVADFFNTANGTPLLLPAIHTVAHTSTADRLRCITAAVCCLLIAVGECHLMVNSYRHTHYYIYALHHMRN